MQRCAPQLLTFVQWAHGARTARHVVGASDHVEAMQAQTGVRQGESLGMLLFARTLQQSLQRADSAANGATPSPSRTT